jgi:hypothetical protein
MSDSLCCTGIQVKHDALKSPPARVQPLLAYPPLHRRRPSVGHQEAFLLKYMQPFP